MRPCFRHFLDRDIQIRLPIQPDHRQLLDRDVRVHIRQLLDRQIRVDRHLRDFGQPEFQHRKFFDVDVIQIAIDLQDAAAVEITHLDRVGGWDIYAAAFAHTLPPKGELFGLTNVSRLHRRDSIPARDRGKSRFSPRGKQVAIPPPKYARNSGLRSKYGIWRNVGTDPKHHRERDGARRAFRQPDRARSGLGHIPGR